MTSSDSNRADNGKLAVTDSRQSTATADNTAPASPDSRPRQASCPDLRQTLRARRDGLSATTVAENSRLIARQVLPLLHGVRHIAGYLAFGNEVNVEPLLARCRAAQSLTFVPLIQPDHTLLFSPLDENTAIVQNRYGIREPEYTAEDCIYPSTLDAVLVPLLGFDPQCHRMGMGGGYYDRSFTHRRQADATRLPTQGSSPLLIGVAHQLQCVDSLTPAWWDVPLDVVVTETRIYRRNSE
ncbi:5-formyltetrahydrofolate cyclo-ligase [Granulosicoccus sp. 3-233]|uniref:5-formyltetrahydrofolate cyclo-ligase n=1 Tax=Granulosicoccus sp. 3-233 TaxID=3417969 RepID=UPI003D3277FE